MNIRYRETLIISLSSPIRDIYKYSKINSLNNPSFILNNFVLFYRQHISMSSELGVVEIMPSIVTIIRYVYVLIHTKKVSEVT